MIPKGQRPPKLSPEKRAKMIADLGAALRGSGAKKQTTGKIERSPKKRKVTP